MEYIILIVTIILIIIVIVQKNNKIEKLNSESEKKEREINNLKNQVVLSNQTIAENTYEINSLKNEIMVLDKELRNYTEIKNDSLNLNIVDKETISEEENFLTEGADKDNKNELNEELSIDYLDLNKEKRAIFNSMESTNNNLFITGKAGTGKSYLLKFFRNKTKKRTLYCAPTGIAALNINGVTLHSAFGWNNLMDKNEIRLSSNKRSLLKNFDTLIIDEISMVRVDAFNQIDLILKEANNSSKPFGGK